MTSRRKSGWSCETVEPDAGAGQRRGEGPDQGGEARDKKPKEQKPKLNDK